MSVATVVAQILANLKDIPFADNDPRRSEAFWEAVVTPLGPPGMNALLHGSGTPGASLGAVGDFYLDTNARYIYGPKTSGGWGVGTSIVGPQGPAGILSNGGATGDIPGPPGPQGNPGPTGSQGFDGPPGQAGPPGIHGDDGEDGFSIPGPAGPQGPQGPQGSGGNPGAPGEDGEDGDEGSPSMIPGPQGPQGPQGQVVPGFDGDPGDDGIPIPGPQGPVGATGATGPQGPAGTGTFPLGVNTGGIALNAANTNPADVLPGSYDVLGTGVTVTARVGGALNSVLGSSGYQTLQANQAYRTVMETSGTPQFVLAFGAAVAGHAGSGAITCSGGIGTFVKTSGTISGDSGNIIVIHSGSILYGVFSITGNAVSGTCTVNTPGSTTAGLSYAIFYPALSASDPGPMTAFAPAFQTTYNQFAVDSLGIPVDGVRSSATPIFRDLGMFWTDSSAHAVLAVAYGAGSCKDNPADGNHNPSPFASVAAGTLITGTSSNPSYGSGATGEMSCWWREGHFLCANFTLYQPNGGGAGSGTYLVNLGAINAAFQIDTSLANVSSSAPIGAASAGPVNFLYAGMADEVAGMLYCYSSTQLMATAGQSGGANTWGSGAYTFGAQASFALQIRIPVPMFAV